MFLNYGRSLDCDLNRRINSGQAHPGPTSKGKWAGTAATNKGRRSGECALIGNTHQLITSPKVRPPLRRTQGGGAVMPPKNSVVVRARDRARPSFSRSILAFGAAAPTAAAVSACGGGNSGSGSSVKDGFTQASQSADPFTVWVDSTRVPAARAYQKAHPSVKLNTVTYDGDANGADTLQTNVGLYDRTGSGWPDVVFSSTDNETSWGGFGRVPGAAERGSHPPGDPEQLRHRLPGPGHRGLAHAGSLVRHAVWRGSPGTSVRYRQLGTHGPLV
jgi:hypothetical protein